MLWEHLIIIVLTSNRPIQVYSIHFFSGVIDRNIKPVYRIFQHISETFQEVDVRLGFKSLMLGGKLSILDVKHVITCMWNTCKVNHFQRLSQTNSGVFLLLLSWRSQCQRRKIHWWDYALIGLQHSSFITPTHTNLFCLSFSHIHWVLNSRLHALTLNESLISKGYSPIAQSIHAQLNLLSLLQDLVKKYCSGQRQML